MKTTEQRDVTNGSTAKMVAGLNTNDVRIEYGILGEEILVSRVHPSFLSFPEGWKFREKVACSERTGSNEPSLSGFLFLKPEGGIWPGLAYPV